MYVPYFTVFGKYSSLGKQLRKNLKEIKEVAGRRKRGKQLTQHIRNMFYNSRNTQSVESTGVYHATVALHGRSLNSPEIMELLRESGTPMECKLQEGSC